MFELTMKEKNALRIAYTMADSRYFKGQIHRRGQQMLERLNSQCRTTDNSIIELKEKDN